MFWCLGGDCRPPMHTGCSYLSYLTAYMHKKVTASSKSMQPSCSFVYSSRTVEAGYVHRRLRLSNTMSTYTIWACGNTSSSMMQATHPGQGCKALTHLFSRFFTIRLVVQIELSRQKVVHCGQLTLCWTLAYWQRPSRWAHNQGRN